MMHSADKFGKLCLPNTDVYFYHPLHDCILYDTPLCEIPHFLSLSPQINDGQMSNLYRKTLLLYCTQICDPLHPPRVCTFTFKF